MDFGGDFTLSIAKSTQIHSRIDMQIRMGAACLQIRADFVEKKINIHTYCTVNFWRFSVGNHQQFHIMSIDSVKTLSTCIVLYIAAEIPSNSTACEITLKLSAMERHLSLTHVGLGGMENTFWTSLLKERACNRPHHFLVTWYTFLWHLQEKSKVLGFQNRTRCNSRLVQKKVKQHRWKATQLVRL